jgi:tRNA(fMet)-specific endonuclease VapC
MKYLLDTNVCIRYLTGRSVNILQRFQATRSQDIAVCSVVKAEMFYGAMKSANPAQTLSAQQRFLNQFVSLPFDDQAAEFYGRERARLAAIGKPVGPNDMMIASIALASNLILVTNNTREFSRIAGLQIEDWE